MPVGSCEELKNVKCDFSNVRATAVIICIAQSLDDCVLYMGYTLIDLAISDVL